MHITLLSASLTGGGVEKAVVELARGFLLNGHKVDLVTIDSITIPDIPKSSNLRIVRISSSRFAFTLPSLFFYFCFNKPDIFLPHQDYVNVISFLSHALCRSQSLFVPVVHAQIRFFAGTRNTLRGSLLYLLLKHVYEHSAHVVTVSNGLRHELISDLSLKPSHVSTIYNPIISDNLELSSLCRPQTNITLPTCVPLILSAGRLVSTKDFPTLLRAFKLVLDVRPAHLVILGTGPERSRLSNLASHYGINHHISFLGYLSNPYPLFAASKIFVLCSTSEGFGNVLVEALALGCSVISTNCQHGPGEILDNGRYGTLVNVGDHRAIAQAILEHLTRPPFPQASLTDYLLRYTVQTSLSDYLLLFSSLLYRANQ